MKNKIVSREALSKIAAEERQSGKIFVATSGCFDILHAGHISYLREAAKMGDIFAVFLNSDISVKSIKGSSRPIVNESERAFVLAALEMVDYVCVFDEPTPCEMILSVKPQVFVKGGDYRGKRIAEIDALLTYGGKMEYASMVEGCSTTSIIARLKGDLK